MRERLETYFDPSDLLLRLSEFLNDDTYDEWLNDWATSIGLGLNILFVLARGTSSSGIKKGSDDVFADPGASKGSGWLSWFVCVHIALFKHG